MNDKVFGWLWSKQDVEISPRQVNTLGGRFRKLNVVAGRNRATDTVDGSLDVPILCVGVYYMHDVREITVQRVIQRRSTVLKNTSFPLMYFTDML